MEMRLVLSLLLPKWLLCPSFKYSAAVYHELERAQGRRGGRGPSRMRYFGLNVYTGVGADGAALALGGGRAQAPQRRALGPVAERPSVSAQAGGAGLRRPHGPVVHGHPVHRAAALPP